MQCVYYEGCVMSIAAFSNFSTGSSYLNSNVKVNSNNEGIKSTDKKQKVIKAVKTAAPIVIPLITIPITAGITYKISSKNNKFLQEQVRNLTDDITKLKEVVKEQAAKAPQGIENVLNSGKKDNAQIWSALIAAAGLAGIFKAADLSEKDKEIISDKLSGRLNSIQGKSDEAIGMAHQTNALSSNSLGRKYVNNYYGIQLLENSDSLNKNAQKYKTAIEKIQTEAPKRLYEAPQIKPISTKNPTLWSVTSEFAPIKEGGLGSVPVEIQNNVTKLGINIPTFIPMYQQKGIASFRTEGGEYVYSYKGKEFKLEKAASFKVDTYQAGRAKTENVEIFVHNSEDKQGNKKQLIFVKNDNYFNGTIYQPSEKTEEPEKFAFFSKAVYELAKAKEDIKSVKDLTIADRNVFESIKSPDALILNDWQASPIAALTRYKAPLENAYGQLSDEASKKLSDMTIITIGHNAMYQGSTRNNNDDAQRREATSNILNTLFDNFAYDIVSNAKTNASKQDPSDFGLKNLDNVLIINLEDKRANHTNLLNMGICLSDYFHPVSQNYAKEIISDEHPELAGELRWALTQKDKSKSLVGIINGNDFNNLSIEAKRDNIFSQTGIIPKTYNKQSSLDEIMSARVDNKFNFYQNYILPLSKKDDKANSSDLVNKIRGLSSKLEFVDKTGRTHLPELSAEELEETPVITSVGRLVSQKGVNVMCDAIKILFDNWEKDFPNKPKPIFYLAGQDGEGGAQRKFIEELKDKQLSQEDTNRVIFAHGFVPMTAMTASSDFFLLPSIFEPCGLTQGEAFAVGTPVIGSAVGGIVDTVNRNGKNNGILTDKSKPLTAQGFYEAMKTALDIYYNDKTKYGQMVRDSLDEDFSWIQKNKKGPVFEYLEKIGINTAELPEVA